MERGPHPLAGLTLVAGLGWTLFMSSAALLTAAVAIAGPFTDLWGEGLQGALVISLVFSALAVLFGWCALHFWLGSIRFEERDIVIKDLFSERRVPRSAIVAFRKSNGKYGTSLTLLDSNEKARVQLPSHLRGIARVEAWATVNLVDARERAAQRELDELAEQSKREGVDFDSRLKSARLYCRILNISAIAACVPGVWLCFDDASPAVTTGVTVILVLMPLIALGLGALMPDVIRQMPLNASKLAAPTGALFTPLIAALILLKDTVLDFGILGWWFGGALLAHFAAYYLIDRSVRRYPASLLLLAFFAAASSFASALTVNNFGDVSTADEVSVEIVSSEAKTGSGKDVRMHYKFRVLLNKEEAEVETDQATFQRMTGRKRATLIVRKGALGIPWVRHDKAFAD